MALLNLWESTGHDELSTTLSYLLHCAVYVLSQLHQWVVYSASQHQVLS
jgi:hypothetical protein